MKLLIAAVAHRSPDWVTAACDEYLKRLTGDWQVEVREIKPAPRQSGKTPQQNMTIEAERLNQALHGRPGPRIALDEKGKVLTSVALSDLLVRYREQSNHLTLIIGGPDGLDPTFKQQCDQKIQLSALTLPHALVRVLLSEQLYRAWSIANGHPYHRE
ncbi:MAG: 23S rRNA (pseudouridine(1915)-N(3))-methyltransferase RlmH [Orrella sp.]